MRANTEDSSRSEEQAPTQRAKGAKALKMLRQLGPGLVTGASGDDPSGIATYCQAGAAMGYGMLWTMLASLPLVIAIQQISATIGRVTGKGIAGNMQGHYPKWLLHGVVLLVLVANIFNLGADLIMMGDSLRLIVGGSTLVYVFSFAILIVLMEIFVPFKQYERCLKGLTVTLFAYVATAFVVHVPWGQVIHSTLVPSITVSGQWFTALTALLGTTISPYMFIWQAAEEVQNEKTSAQERPLLKAPDQAKKHLRRISMDTRFGMVFSGVTAWFIMITAAATLHAHGITDIQNSTQAASALRPLAGPLAFYLFAAGIIGTGLLSVPVLAGSAAYAVGEALGLRVGLQYKPHQARRFYFILAGASLVGLGMALSGLNPIKALYASAVINGVVAGPIMVVLVLMGTNRKIMGRFTLSPGLARFGWIAAAVMIISALALLGALR